MCKNNVIIPIFSMLQYRQNQEENYGKSSPDQSWSEESASEIASH